MSTQPVRQFTPAEYLEFERRSEIKHEYFRGEMFAMAGVTREHALILYNIIRRVGNQLDDDRCEVYPGDVRVKVHALDLYTYPDMIITCQEPQFEDDRFDTLLNPQVLVEVLSDSTEPYDRGKMFEHYRRIESLLEYVLVAQNEPHVEVYSRQVDDGWLLTEAKGLDATIGLPAIDCQLKLAEVYAKVEFKKAPK